MGLRVEDVEDEYAIEYWPDTEPAIFTFIQLRTQWRMGFSGPVGLDYTAAETLMRIRRVPASKRADLLDDLRVMEDEALRTLAEEKK